MATIVKEYTFADGTAARPEQMNANFDVIVAVINGNIDWDNLKASLVNAANGILKLDASGDVPLAQIPDTLTGKDADTVDTKHYSDITTKITADIATHDAIAAAHHAKTVSSDIDHGSVGGLTHDDHTQYLKKAPNYDSGWRAIATSATEVFTHSLGTVDLLVQVYGKKTTGEIHSLPWAFLGGGSPIGYYWHTLTTNSISVERGAIDSITNFVRVRLWKLS